MKKLLCFLLCLVLIFSSVSLCFAQDWSASDSQNLQNVAGRLYYMNQSAAYYLYNIATNTNNLYNKTVDIYNTLFNDGHNITYWIRNISSWMSPIYNAITNVPVDLSTIIGALGYFDSNNTYHPYLNDLKYGLLNTYLQGYTTTSDKQKNSHLSLLDANWKWNFNRITGLNQNGISQYNWYDGSPLGNIAFLLKLINDNFVSEYRYRWQADLTGYNLIQTGLSWTDIEQSITFTPSSFTDGLYKWLSNIQEPAARLSYVLASDERIAAQEAAAANEEAVVDNFIDSSGNGAASPSDIGSVSTLSSGYKQNFGSDASPSGIFDIFNSDHATWFSQETKNQLDTTTPSRMTKGSASETPLLDKQIEDIYDALGVKQP